MVFKVGRLHEATWGGSTDRRDERLETAALGTAFRGWGDEEDPVKESEKRMPRIF